MEYYLKLTKEQRQLLRAAGYAEWHRPYFAMAGCTRQLFTVRPAEKTVIDAAPDGASTTPWEEFVRLHPLP